MLGTVLLAGYWHVPQKKGMLLQRWVDKINVIVPAAFCSSEIKEKHPYAML